MTLHCYAVHIQILKHVYAPIAKTIFLQNILHAMYTLQNFTKLCYDYVCVCVYKLACNNMFLILHNK